MKIGAWLAPRYTDRSVFEKDYPHIDLNALEVHCPGCQTVVRLSRKSSAGRIAGWCRQCSRAVTA